VSLLGELSAKRKWGAPNYTLVMEEGPAHAKNFIFKVSVKFESLRAERILSSHNTQFEIQLTSQVQTLALGTNFLFSSSHPHPIVQQVRLNGIDYTSPVSSNNKKEAKSAVAKFCLQQLGILPP
jgi:dsRNA-specific ribonuclease